MNLDKLKEKTHLFYWQKKAKNRCRLNHPGVYDEFIPEEIRGKQYNGWQEIAYDLGYKEK